MAKDYYKILGVNKNANDEDLKLAYKQLVKRYHPDISKEPNAEEKLKEITEAYAVLSDPSKRQQYDMFGSNGPQGSGFSSQGFSGQGFNFDFSDVFSQFDFSDDDFFSGFRNMHRGRSKRESWVDLDLRTKINIDFITAIKGGKVSVGVYKDVVCDSCDGTGSKSKSKTICSACSGKGRTLTKRQTPFGIFAIEQTCSKCQGEGKINTDPCKKCEGKGYVKKEIILGIDVPAGINNGDVIRLRGQGNTHNGESGDLFVSVSVTEHEFFKREGYDLYCEIPIIYSELILGTKIKIKGIQDTINLTIPAGTRPETIFKVSGKGSPNPNKRGVHGSLFVKVIQADPIDVNRDYKQLLEKLATLDSKTKKKIQDKFKSYVEF